MLQRIQTNYLGKQYMPVKLKAVLVKHGIKQPDWCKAILQSSGQPMSLSAGNSLINWDVWPTLTSQESIIKQTAIYLRSHGVPDAEIAVAWELDDQDEARHGHPAGVHEGQHASARPDIDTIGDTEMLSPNAKKLFQLFKDPFQNDVNSHEDVYLNPSFNYVRQAIFTTAKHGGLMAAVGESGAGKSILRRDLSDRIHREALPIVVIFPQLVDKERITAGSLCDAIIMDLEPDARSPQTLEKKARLVLTLLKASMANGRTHVIVIEEAHDLTIGTLKILKRFWEMEDGFKKMLSIVLVGQPELKKKLDEDRYPKAREFIRRCELVELEPLNKHLAEYLKFKLERVGSSMDAIFEDGAIQAIETRLTSDRSGRPASLLYPLIVNNLVTKAMNLAAEIGETKITADVIRHF